MNSNELLSLDAHSLQKIIVAREEEIRGLEQTKQSLLRDIIEKPSKVVIDLDAEIASRTKVRDALDAEIAVQKSVLAHTQKTGHTVSQSLSDETKLHQQNASNAILRQKIAEEALEKVKKERELHDKATTVALEARKQSQEASTEAERQRIRCQLETKAATEERDLMLQEVEETRILLERYRADKLNLEKWEEKLNNREMFLEEVARQLGVTEVTT